MVNKFLGDIMKLLYTMLTVLMVVVFNSSIVLAETVETTVVTPHEEFRVKCEDKKDMDACVELGVIYISIDQDYSNALKYLEKACDGKNMLGCGILGHLYQEGMGVKQDYKKAVKLFKRSCDGGELAGCGALGDMHAEGNGTKQNSNKALELYKKACDGNIERGCSSFKTLYEKECSTDPKKFCSKYKK